MDNKDSDNSNPKNDKLDTIWRTLGDPDSSTAVLREIAEGLGWLAAGEREKVASALVRHGNFTTVDAAAAVGSLNAMWWGDDPIECGLGGIALEHALAAAGIELHNPPTTDPSVGA